MRYDTIYNAMMKEAAGFSPMQPGKPDGSTAGAIPGMKQMAPAPQQAPAAPARPQTQQPENPLVNDFSKALNAFTSATQKYQEQPVDPAIGQQANDASQLPQPTGAPDAQAGSPSTATNPAPLPKMASGRYEPGAGWIPDSTVSGSGSTKGNKLLGALLANAIFGGVGGTIGAAGGALYGGANSVVSKNPSFKRLVKDTIKGGVRGGGLGAGASLGWLNGLIAADALGASQEDAAIAADASGVVGAGLGYGLSDRAFDWLNKKRIERKRRNQNLA